MDRADRLVRLGPAQHTISNARDYYNWQQARIAFRQGNNQSTEEQGDDKSNKTYLQSVLHLDGDLTFQIHPRFFQLSSNEADIKLREHTSTVLKAINSLQILIRENHWIWPYFNGMITASIARLFYGPAAQAAKSAGFYFFMIITGLLLNYLFWRIRTALALSIKGSEKEKNSMKWLINAQDQLWQLQSGNKQVWWRLPFMDLLVYLIYLITIYIIYRGYEVDALSLPWTTIFFLVLPILMRVLATWGFRQIFIRIARNFF